MRSSIVFLIFLALIGTAILIGGSMKGTATPPPASATSETPPPPAATAPSTAAPTPLPEIRSDIPHIGSVRVLNGCGINNAANQVAEFLRGKGFDVKDVDNAPSWNYPYTIIASRTRDMGNAEKVAAALSTERIIMLRTEERMYDVVVFVGADYKERIP